MIWVRKQFNSSSINGVNSLLNNKLIIEIIY